MTRLAERLLDFLSDSNLTAKFQHLCGVRSNIVDKYAGKDGNNCAGICGSCDSSTATDRRDTAGSGCNLRNKCLDSCSANGSVKSEMNGHSDYGAEANHSNHISNGFSKEHAVIRRNGYRNGLTSLDQFTNVLTHTLTDHNNVSTNLFVDMLKQSQNGMEPKSNNGFDMQTKPVHSATSYTIQSWLLYYIFSFGAALGNELFYILFFSSTLWNFDSFVVRKLLIVWCVIMYLGQAAKDVIRWPRPKSPPVIRLEERYELEYGMPSTHAMVGIVIPFGMIIFMSGRYEFDHSLGLTLAFIWSILVSLSRLYLGMHSVLDIIAGKVFAVCLIAVTVLFVDPLDNFLMSHPIALPATIIACIVLCLSYPALDKWSTARGDTTLVLAVFSGIYAGMWLTGKLTDIGYLQDSPPYTLELPSTRDVGLGLMRQAVGLTVIVFILTIIKMIILHSLSWFFKFDPKDPKTKQHHVVELPYKYISYYVSALASTYIMPLLFLQLNIERPSYYSEVFSQSL